MEYEADHDVWEQGGHCVLRNAEAKSAEHLPVSAVQRCQTKVMEAEIGRWQRQNEEQEQE